jgi:hypothetical protein
MVPLIALICALYDREKSLPTEKLTFFSLSKCLICDFSEIFLFYPVLRIRDVFIPDPGSGYNHCSIPDPGGKKAPDPGSGSISTGTLVHP